MLKRYTWGNPIDTGALVKKNPKLVRTSLPDRNRNLFRSDLPDNFTITENTIRITIDSKARIYGLGEALGGVNKRGRIYRNFCTDDPDHYEDKVSLYAAHNFLLFNYRGTYGIFIDYPGAITYDLCFSKPNEIIIDFEKRLEEVSFEMFLFFRTAPMNYLQICKSLRRLTGRSYLPPKWAFGYGQSRWGYKDAEDIRAVLKGYKDNMIPLSMIYLDIDYMEDFKDFTVSKERFPDFKNFVAEMLSEGVKLIPIIDAAVKVQNGYDVYEEGKCPIQRTDDIKEKATTNTLDNQHISDNQGGYFCKNADGNDFLAAVWPGKSVLPDFLNSKVRKWFGDKYKYLIDMGIRGFWNDMNEPAIFYSESNLSDTFEKIDSYKDKNIGIYDYFDLMGTLSSLSNSDDDYKSFYHITDYAYSEDIKNNRYKKEKHIPERKVRHYDVHNLYGYNMTKAAAESFERNYPDEEFLLFSRSSYIGAHRYGGIWQGDNKSIWSHLKMNFQMMPGLNMCGFLYTGADIGGFGANTCDELMLRWLHVGTFTPLYRNHAALGTKNQELYNLTMIPEFRFFINMRYRLMPYIYNQFKNAVENHDMLFKPMEFVYPKDTNTYEIEDQLIFGESIMLAPVLEPNKSGRIIYFPSKMKEIRFARQTKKNLQKANENNLNIVYIGAFFMDNDFNPVDNEDYIKENNLEEFGINEEMLSFIKSEKVMISVDEHEPGYHYISMPLDELVVFM